MELLASDHEACPTAGGHTPRGFALALALMLAGCTSRSSDEQAPRPSPAPTPAAEAPPPEPPASPEPPPQPAASPQPAAPDFVADDLRDVILTIPDLASYPPTACHLHELLDAETFEQLVTNGGSYLSDKEADDGGFFYFGMACPQPDCDSAKVWVHPDGGMVVALRGGDAVRLSCSRPELCERLPSTIQSFVADAKTSHATTAGTFDPALCHTPELEARRERFVRAKRKLACDHEYSPFWTAAAVAPREGERAYFHREPSTDTRRDGFVLAGDLVTLASPHAEHENFVCAEYVSLAGQRTTGWLRTADVSALSFMFQPPPRAELERWALDAPAGWLRVGEPQRLGALELERSADDRVRVELSRAMNGHVCGIHGTLRLAGPRVLEDIDTGCGTVGVLFNNGVALWEDDDYGCSGVRASCSDAYLARPKP